MLFMINGYISYHNLFFVCLPLPIHTTQVHEKRHNRDSKKTLKFSQECSYFLLYAIS